MRFAQATAGASGASLFLVDADARTIGGLLSDWDWIRTSFAVPLGHWPTVGLALGDGQVHTIRAEGAHGDEARWFEPLGTVSTACVPLRSSEGAPLGVIFFDFDAETNASRDFLAAIGERVSRRSTATAPGRITHPRRPRCSSEETLVMAIKGGAAGLAIDPTHPYFLRLARVALLTREGEVVLAKRIEQGELDALKALLSCPAGIAEIAKLGERLKRGDEQIERVIDGHEDEPGWEERETARVLLLVAKVTRKTKAPDVTPRVLEAFAEMKLNKVVLGEIARKLQKALRLAEKSEDAAVKEQLEGLRFACNGIAQGHRVSTLARGELVEANLRLVEARIFVDFTYAPGVGTCGRRPSKLARTGHNGYTVSFRLSASGATLMFEFAPVL